MTKTPLLSRRVAVTARRRGLLTTERIDRWLEIGTVVVVVWAFLYLFGHVLVAAVVP